MDNDSWLFPAHLPLDDMFDWNGDGKITGFENVLRDAHWINAFESKPEPTTSLPFNWRKNKEDHPAVIMWFCVVRFLSSNDAFIRTYC